jgi:hypothetical protein
MTPTKTSLQILQKSAPRAVETVLAAVVCIDNLLGEVCMVYSGTETNLAFCKNNKITLNGKICLLASRSTFLFQEQLNGIVIKLIQEL